MTVLAQSKGRASGHGVHLLDRSARAQLDSAGRPDNCALLRSHSRHAVADLRLDGPHRGSAVVEFESGTVSSPIAPAVQPPAIA
jgi:hypothetical protein